VKKSEPGAQQTISIQIPTKSFGEPGDRFIFDVDHQIAWRYRRLAADPITLALFITIWFIVILGLITFLIMLPRRRV
jgi:hypothetical protein